MALFVVGPVLGPVLAASLSQFSGPLVRDFGLGVACPRWLDRARRLYDSLPELALTSLLVVISLLELALALAFVSFFASRQDAGACRWPLAWLATRGFAAAGFRSRLGRLRRRRAAA